MSRSRPMTAPPSAVTTAPPATTGRPVDALSARQISVTFSGMDSAVSAGVAGVSAVIEVVPLGVAAQPDHTGGEQNDDRDRGSGDEVGAVRRSGATTAAGYSEATATEGAAAAARLTPTLRRRAGAVPSPEGAVVSVAGASETAAVVLVSVVLRPPRVRLRGDRVRAGALGLLAPLGAGGVGGVAAGLRRALGPGPLDRALGVGRDVQLGVQVLGAGIGLGRVGDPESECLVDQLPAGDVVPVDKVTAMPVLPARPVRPMRCT